MSGITGRAICAGGGKSKPDFYFSGGYTEREDGVVELRSSGMLKFLKKATIDRFMVGGGGSGSIGYYSAGNEYPAGGSGGGGGYTRMDYSVEVTAGQEINIIIGSGGERQLSGVASGSANDGGQTKWGDVVVEGGKGALAKNFYMLGGNGGSGGGGGIKYNDGYASDGGSNGSNGGGSRGGTGQGTTTREFAEATGKLYAGGGGGGGGYGTSAFTGRPGGAGGAGGGGAGGTGGAPSISASTGGSDGEANTGGGGGGGAGLGGYGTETYGGAGGSGIICFRLAVL